MRYIKIVFLTAAAVLSFQSSFVFGQDQASAQPAESKETNLIQSWTLNVPERGKLYLIVRDSGVVSYFWQNWENERVLRAKWDKVGTGISFVLDSGESVSLNPVSTGVVQAVLNSGIEGEAPIQVRAQALNQDVVGKWHDPSAGEEETSKFLKKAGNVDVFFGTWEVISSKGLPYYIVIERDRTAATNWPYSKRGVEGMRGFWVRQGAELHIIWDTGHYDILRSFSDRYIKLGYPPSVDLHSLEPAPQPALKVNWFPNEPWRASYEESKKTPNPHAGLWTSAKNASRYFRGEWKLLSSPGEQTKLSMGRFGSARATRDGEKLKGTWKNAADYATIRWDNGFTEVIRPVGKYFVTMLYSPLKNLDGIPDRVCSLDPEDPAKFSKKPNRVMQIPETIIKAPKKLKFPKLPKIPNPFKKKE